MARYKGKRIMFVGDSLSLNQWQSLTCMLHAAVPRSRYTVDRQNDLSTFTMPVSFSSNSLFHFPFFFFNTVLLISVSLSFPFCSCLWIFHLIRVNPKLFNHSFSLSLSLSSPFCSREIEVWWVFHLRRFNPKLFSHLFSLSLFPIL